MEMQRTLLLVIRIHDENISSEIIYNKKDLYHLPPKKVDFYCMKRKKDIFDTNIYSFDVKCCKRRGFLFAQIFIGCKNVLGACCCE